MLATRREVLALGATALVATAVPRLAWAEDAALPKPPVLGDAKAPKRLVVWGSFTCPYTAVLVAELDKLVTDMPKKVCVEWRHFPTHPPDPALHVAGLAFQDKHFFGFAFRVLRNVYDERGQYNKLTPEKLAEFAKAEGGSEKMLKAAYEDKAKWAAVKRDLMAGELMGVKMTPGLFFNGYFLTPGGLPADIAAFDKSLRAMIDA